MRSEPRHWQEERRHEALEMTKVLILTRGITDPHEAITLYQDLFTLISERMRPHQAKGTVPDYPETGDPY